LFATLDTTTRKVALPNTQPLLLTDTVGFVRKLPHRLVEAFNATLEEAVQADFLIHLLDASQPQVIEFYNTTQKVLAELGAEDKPTLIVFNKTDKVADRGAVLTGLRRHFPKALFISVHTGAGLPDLIEQLANLVGEGSVTRELHLPARASAHIARHHRQAEVLQTDYDGDEVRIVATLSPRLMAEFGEFIVEHAKKKAVAPAHSVRDIIEPNG
jgi:GTP-binding protein HflX